MFAPKALLWTLFATYCIGSVVQTKKAIRIVSNSSVFASDFVKLHNSKEKCICGWSINRRKWGSNMPNKVAL